MKMVSFDANASRFGSVPPSAPPSVAFQGANVNFGCGAKGASFAGHQSAPKFPVIVIHQQGTGKNLDVTA